MFEKLTLYCDSYIQLIPISFVLGEPPPPPPASRDPSAAAGSRKVASRQFRAAARRRSDVRRDALLLALKTPASGGGSDSPWSVCAGGETGQLSGVDRGPLGARTGGSCTFPRVCWSSPGERPPGGLGLGALRSREMETRSPRPRPSPPPPVLLLPRLLRDSGRDPLVEPVREPAVARPPHEPGVGLGGGQGRAGPAAAPHAHPLRQPGQRAHPAQRQRRRLQALPQLPAPGESRWAGPGRGRGRELRAGPRLQTGEGPWRGEGTVGTEGRGGAFFLPSPLLVVQCSVRTSVTSIPDLPSRGSDESNLLACSGQDSA